MNSSLGTETKEAFFQCLSEASRAMSAVYAHVPPHVQQQIGISMDNERKEAFFQLLQTLEVKDSKLTPVPPLELPDADQCWNPVLKFLQRPELQLVHLIRLMLLLHAIRRPAFGPELCVFSRNFDSLLDHFQASHSFNLQDVALAFRTVGLDENLIGDYQVRAWDGAPRFKWPKETIWPYWSEHLDMLEKAVEATGDAGLGNARKNALAIIATFPEPPVQFVDRLWDLSFGAKDRTEAQEALRHEPHTFGKLLREIASADSDRRTIAAEWLGRFENKSAIEPLTDATKREKSVTARGAMLLALESLGANFDALDNREALFKEATDGLSGGIPEDLQWFPFSSMPVVHWNDTGKPVSAEILQWWVIETFKLKNPEPGPLLRRYCSQFVPVQREAFGRFVLQQWISQETYTRKGPLALTCKGIVAIAAACCGADAASAARSYLTKYPRDRAGQCKALVQMLAWIDHPAATQLLLAVSARFKPATIQEEATRLSLALAERKNWTLEQMADRAIPSAGLDENGDLKLSYGPRSFIARLNNHLECVLADNTGKQIKSLPSPRASDDEAMAKESKRAFSDAKKELKSILQIQRDRLYEAMCIQRTWSFEEWDAYYRRHPVMRFLCRRLVWTASSDNKSPVIFRLLDDGSLTDADDKSVEPPADSRIALAHESQLPAETGRLWREHLVDYEVEPLFPQFGVHEFTLSETQRGETDLKSFEGHTIDAFNLRTRAGKLGYSRGTPVDGPWFNEYLKTFSTLGITGVIAFTGNAMPEENRLVALTELHFVRGKRQSMFNVTEKIPLGEVPPVLFSKCYNHLRQIAGGGYGFDPDWKKKTTIL